MIPASRFPWANELIGTTIGLEVLFSGHVSFGHVLAPLLLSDSGTAAVSKMKEMGGGDDVLQIIANTLRGTVRFAPLVVYWELTGEVQFPLGNVGLEAAARSVLGVVGLQTRRKGICEGTVGDIELVAASDSPVVP